jgi:hypothetical protein
MSKNRVNSERIVVMVAACLMIAIGPQVFGYSCGTPSSGHCYGTTSWSEHPEYFGAYTDIRETTLSCPSGCGGFVDDEIWLIDTHTAGCTTNGFGVCWVEAGIIAIDGSSQVYFWADARPMTTSTFNLHLLGGTDGPGVNDHFMIIKDARGGPGIVQLWIYNDGLSTLYNGTSTSNPMSANRIDIGQELAGTHSASAGNADFTRNIWAVQALGPEYVFWYNRQVHDTGVGSANPPFASWAVSPTSPPPPEGGRFRTHCCS